MGGAGHRAPGREGPGGPECRVMGAEAPPPAPPRPRPRTAPPPAPHSPAPQAPPRRPRPQPCPRHAHTVPHLGSHSPTPQSPAPAGPAPRAAPPRPLGPHPGSHSPAPYKPRPPASQGDSLKGNEGLFGALDHGPIQVTHPRSISSLSSSSGWTPLGKSLPLPPKVSLLQGLFYMTMASPSRESAQCSIPPLWPLLFPDTPESQLFRRSECATLFQREGRKGGLIQDNAEQPSQSQA